MRNSNFALRLQSSLMEEARELAKAEGVALNQLINVAVAEKLAAHRTAAFLDRYTQGANTEAAVKLLSRPRSGEPPRDGDELPDGWTTERMDRTMVHKRGGNSGKSQKGRAHSRRAGQKADDRS